MKPRRPLTTAASAALICLLIAAVVFYAYRSPDQQPMINKTLEWGQLKPFPPTAQNFTIEAERSIVTHAFRGSFTDTPQNIQAWLDASEGVRQGKTERRISRVQRMRETETNRITFNPTSPPVALPAAAATNSPLPGTGGLRITLKTAGGAKFGELTVSPDRTQVNFYVSLD